MSQAPDPEITLRLLMTASMNTSMLASNSATCCSLKLYSTIFCDLQDQDLPCCLSRLALHVSVCAVNYAAIKRKKGSGKVSCQVEQLNELK